MKKTFILLASAGLLVSLPSCSEWLTATSSSQISDTRLFSSRNGFQEALSGVYLCMAQSDCYGMEYTWFMNDLAAFPYAAQHDNTFSSIQNRNFTNSVTFPIVTRMWQSGYHAIANINKMLDELDKRRDVITDDTEYRLMKGELLGLRAWIHFDILRMWGLGDWGGDNAGKMTVPYVRNYDKEPSIQRSYAETAGLLMSDIDEAIELLEVDPVRGTVDEAFQAAINTNGFWDNRLSHLNWYAVKGLKARVLIMQDRHAEAVAIAKEVIDEVLAKDIVRWVDPIAQLNTADNDARDWTFSCEHLFTLEVPDLYSSVQPYFFSSANSSGLRIDPSIVASIYEGPVGFSGDISDGTAATKVVTLAGDIRGSAMMLRFSGAGYIPYKFYASSSSVYRNRMPMFRLSELYLMLAEDACIRKDLTGFLDAINEIHAHRGIDEAILPDEVLRHGTVVDGETVIVPDLEDLLVREYAIELVGEGQFLPFLKRFTHHMGNGAVNVYLTTGERFPRPSELMLPYPSAETSYGHIQEL